jgi:hypothetical protein
MLATLFSLLALLIVHQTWKTRYFIPGFVAALICIWFAIFAKEAAFATPILIGFYITFQTWTALNETDNSHLVRNLARAVARNVPRLVCLLAPLIAYLIIYAGNQSGDSVYAIDDLPNRIFGIPTFLLNPFRYLGTAFFIVETTMFQSAISGFDALNTTMLITMIRAGVAILLNALIWVATIFVLIQRGLQSRIALLAALALISSALPIILKADPRFMYFGQAFTIPLMLAVFQELYDEALKKWTPKRWSKSLVIALLGTAILIGPVYFLLKTVSRQESLVERNELAGLLRRELDTYFEDPAIKRVYILNDLQGLGGLAKYRFFRSLHEREDVDLRLINILNGLDANTPSPDEGVNFEQRGNQLRIVTTIGENEQFFTYLTPEEARNLGVENLISYGPMTEFSQNAWGKPIFVQKTLEVFIENANILDYVVIGFDPTSSYLHVYLPDEGEWRPIAQWSPRV